MQARRGELVDVLDGDGAVALAGDRPLGLVTWTVTRAGGPAAAAASTERPVAGGAASTERPASAAAASTERPATAAGAIEAEIRALAVGEAARGQGVGAALLEAAERGLRAASVSRAWLVTTNDNLAALALYQKAGWRLVALRTGAIDVLRGTVKPSLPETGQHGIPLRDELELAKDL